MVKRTLQGALALMAGALLGGAAEPAQAPTPPVTKVLLYPDRAQLTRALDVNCSGGTAVARFGGLAAELEPTSLKASASGTGAMVEGLSMNDQVLREPFREEVQKLTAALEELDAKIAGVMQDRSRAQSLGEQALSLRTQMGPFLNREAAQEKKPQTEIWKSGLDAAAELYDDATQKRRAADAQLRELSRQREELTRKLNAMNSARPTRVVDAEVLVRCGGPVHVELSYVVGGAGWAPVYEARADPKAGRVAFTVGAEVRQGTGESWNDVEVTLTTATPHKDATPPKLRQLYVGASEPQDTKKVLVRRDEVISHAEENLPSAGKAPTGGLPNAFADQGLSVQLRVAGKVDVPGDGRPSRVAVETLDLPANFGLYAAPKMLPHVFRSAELSNGARYPLIPGRIDLFSGGSYVGTSALERTAQGGKIELSFGVVETVKVKRTTLDEQKKEPGLLSSTRRLSYAYRVELSSFEPTPVTVKLQEQVPVSQMDDVKVLIDEAKTTKGYVLEKDDGILTWKVQLVPGQAKNVELFFGVEVPDKYDSSAL